MKVNFLHELVDYLHGDKPYEVRNYIMEQIAKTKDNNKGYFWEHVLKKGMSSHTQHIGGNERGRDFTDNTDAKIAVFYKRNDGVYEASVGNIRTKIGTLRICAVVPGTTYHRTFFLLIPPEGYKRYIDGSDCLKLTLKAGTGNINEAWAKYVCSFDEVCKPINE